MSEFLIAARLIFVECFLEKRDLYVLIQIQLVRPLGVFYSNRCDIQCLIPKVLSSSQLQINGDRIECIGEPNFLIHTKVDRSITRRVILVFELGESIA